MTQTQNYLNSSRTYRPTRFDQVIGQDICVRTLKNSIRMGKVGHAYLFAGSRGTGKTTLVRIFAKALNCQNIDPLSLEPCTSCSICKEIAEGRSLDVLEIDGASNRGIDDIRSLSESVGYAPTKGNYKIFIIDEVHMLTKEAFNALLKTLEEPPPTVKFFFATTEPHKLPETILSRCLRFNLRRLPHDSIISKLSTIAQGRNLSVEPTVLETIAHYADGGLRDAESLFDQLSAYSSNNTLMRASVEDVLGIAPLSWFEELDKALCQGTTQVAFTLTEQLLFASKDLSRFIDDLSCHFRCIFLAKIEATPDVTAHATLSSVPEVVKLLSQEQIHAVFSFIQEAMKAIKTVSSPRFILEKLLLDIITVRYHIPLPYIVRKLAQLEEKIASAPLAEKNEIAKNLLCETTPPLSHAPTIETQKTLDNIRPKPYVTTSAEQEKERQATVLQFAAVELEGTLQKKKRT